MAFLPVLLKTVCIVKFQGYLTFTCFVIFQKVIFTTMVFPWDHGMNKKFLEGKYCRGHPKYRLSSQFVVMIIITKDIPL